MLVVCGSPGTLIGRLLLSGRATGGSAKQLSKAHPSHFSTVEVAESIQAWGHRELWMEILPPGIFARHTLPAL